MSSPRPVAAPTNTIDYNKLEAWEGRLKKLDDLVLYADALASDRYGSSVPWDKGSRMITQLFLITSTLVMFATTDYLSVCVAIAALFFQTSQSTNLSYVKLLALSVLASVVWDVLWIFLNEDYWAHANKTGENKPKIY